ncbi:phosphoribosylaminoimidazolesuccinocarboxamide synthase [Candidatus Methylomirabilis limnetica]|jgi:phosphoribosylaminoimidazole-succinocarboxamide synthase|uniref:Phosphoribosylaminoimidazole-succinocarboxamide synthase n=1 Tax=Candidatus Methylomirabilis limnetica TaxID=2033718 RepID=A0A2T4U1B1_9BACT|nr:phosphoribosylaminoimidazolesuccinocarboxamide synthase [Candidatus Methylomirabilis limnetica]PTL37154.1 phosphoribosylaminoimidazolesuccinocarboxamide synthase [Candidatus Methylomirabilis limnetica]
MTESVVHWTEFHDLVLHARGKVRDIYDFGDSLLLVATDRISAFDVVLPTAIPGKGRVLTALSAFWFQMTADLTPNHLITTDVEAYPKACQPYRETLAGRSMLVRKTKPLPIECIVRGYLSGSGWAEYQKTGAVCGISLPAGLLESCRLDPPLFTPSTKAEQGAHDVNITFDEAAAQLGLELAERVRDLSLALYERARAYALERGIIIADTKFEFGLLDGNLIFIDEVLTPDSSRFWPCDTYTPGRSQPSYDKQFVRDYLKSIAWEMKAPGPELPPEIVARTSAKYQEALIQLTGADLSS